MEQTALKPSRNYEIAVLLTLAGGFLDAYTYACRGGVFANAQTGNTVKLAIFLARGDYGDSLRFVISILAFFLGTLIAVHLENVLERKGILFVRRGVLLLEMGLVTVVSFLPQEEHWNMLANTLVSLLCAMQMECFRTFVGQPITTTVATGNLRKFVEFLYKFASHKDPGSLKAAMYYLLTVFIFCLGAALGTVMTGKIGVTAVRFLLLLYGASFAIITYRRKKLDAQTK